MKIFQRLSQPFVVFVERYYPDPFVFVILLTVATFLLAFGLTDTTPIDAVNGWGEGLSGLLTFMGQLSITLIAAHALAHTDAAKNLLSKLAKVPKTEFQAYFLVALISGIANLFAWALGLVVGAIIARQVAVEGDKRGLHLHYPLLVATAYAGFVLWHMGYSSTSALFVATSGHVLEAEMGILPVTETIFSTHNITTALVTLIAICVVCPLMMPDKKDIFKVKAKVLQKSLHQSTTVKQSDTLADALNHSKLITIILGGLIGLYLFDWFAQMGLNLNLNIVNWTFLCLGLLLARSPMHYMELVKNASSLLGPIVLQYPFYAGIMGLMKGTGLVDVMSVWFMEIATADTLSFWAFISGGVVNMFVPSGGGQWVVQGPIFIEAAKNLGVDPAAIVLGISYGDQWTNMIQPFWTIPLLAIAGIDMRKIMGYTFVIFLVTFITLGGSLLILGAG